MSDRHDVFLTIADTVGQLGTCDRAHIGAVIVMDGRCISWGYNGAPPGLPHCDDNAHGWAELARENAQMGERERWIDWQLEVHGCRNATHAEANAIAFAARQGISTDDATLYVSVAPCLSCSRLIIAAGIKAVYCQAKYRLTEGVELLDDAGIEVYTRDGE